MTDTPEQGSKRLLIPSSRFGELEVEEKDLIVFPSGIIGFPRANRFIMIPHVDDNDESTAFSWLHSADDPNLAFVVIDGEEFARSNSIAMPTDAPELEMQDGDEFAVLIIVTVREDPKMTTANTKAPLFVNLRNRKGVQVIFDDPRFSTRFNLWADEAGSGDTAQKPEGKESDPPKKD